MNASWTSGDVPIPDGRPFVSVSYAQTLDGRLATRSGSSQWISGAESLRFAHELRAAHDAIMVGVGTVLQDDPRLTVRLVALPPGQNQPLRVIVDSHCRTPPTAMVLTDGAAEQTVLAVTERADKSRCAQIRALGSEILVLPADARERVDLAALLAVLRAREVRTLLVEGGSRLITSLLQGRLVDRLVVCIAPKILGSGIEAIGDLGSETLADALALDTPRLIPFGSDLVLDGRIRYPEQRDAG